MPRPKPDSKLEIRNVRLNDESWEEFKRRGGIIWLRESLESKSVLPERKSPQSQARVIPIKPEPRPRTKPMGANSIFNMGAML